MMIKFIALAFYIWSILFQLYTIKDEGGLNLFKLGTVKQKFVFVVRVMIFIPIFIILAIVINLFEMLNSLVEKIDNSFVEWGDR